jgi:hypothetical protein
LTKHFITKNVQQFEGNISKLTSDYAGMLDRLNSYDLIDATQFHTMLLCAIQYLIQTY